MENQAISLLQKWAKANNIDPTSFKAVVKSLTASDFVSLQTAFDNNDYYAVSDIFYATKAELSESFKLFNYNLHESIVPNKVFSDVLKLSETQLKYVVSDILSFNTQLTYNHIRSLVYEALTSSVTSNVTQSASNPNDINSQQSQQQQQTPQQSQATQTPQQNQPNQIDLLKQLQTALQSKPNSKINISNPENGTSNIQTVSGIDIDPNNPENTKVVASDGSTNDNVNIYDLNDIDLVNEELKDFNRLAGINNGNTRRH